MKWPDSSLWKALQPDSALWRRAMVAGVAFAPGPWVRYSPPLFGLAFAAALPQARSVVRANLRRVLGPRPPAREMLDVAAVFANYASCLTEALLVGMGRKGVVASQPQGVEHYHAARAIGRGILIATAHTAGWEVAGPVLSGIHPGGEVVVAMQRERDPQARAIQDSARARAGVKVVHIGESPLDALPLLRHLQNGAVVAMQIDRVPPGMRQRTVQLFGGDWPAPEGPLALAALSGSPILPVFTRRVGFMQYEAIVSPAICLPRRPSREQLDEAAQRMMNAMQAVVRAYPTQWFHFV